MAAQAWSVKIRDLVDNTIEQVATFTSNHSAEAFRSRLINGYGGLFATQYDIWIEEQKNTNKKVKNG